MLLEDAKLEERTLETPLLRGAACASRELPSVLKKRVAPPGTGWLKAQSNPSSVWGSSRKLDEAKQQQFLLLCVEGGGVPKPTRVCRFAVVNAAPAADMSCGC